MAHEQAEQAIRQCSQRRFEAMIRGDLTALDELLADHLTYTHASGRLDFKAPLLKDIASGRNQYESITAEEVCVRVYHAVGILTGTVQMRAKIQGNPRNHRLRFTEVYHKADARWQLVAWQSTVVPEG